MAPECGAMLQLTVYVKQRSSGPCSGCILENSYLRELHPRWPFQPGLQLVTSPYLAPGKQRLRFAWFPFVNTAFLPDAPPLSACVIPTPASRRTWFSSHPSHASSPNAPAPNNSSLVKVKVFPMGRVQMMAALLSAWLPLQTQTCLPSR